MSHTSHRNMIKSPTTNYNEFKLYNIGHKMEIQKEITHLIAIKSCP
jgi:hypothetical protein